MAGQLSPNSVVDYIKITKQFIGWLNEARRSKDNPINVSRLKGAARGIEGAGQTPFDPEDLLSQEEIKAMITAANTIRNKCFIAVLFEAHARVGEIGRMVWGDLDFSNPDYISGQVRDSKAKKWRYPAFVDSQDMLIALRNSYAYGTPEGNAFVFLESDGTPITYTAAKKMLIRAAEKAMKVVPSLENKPYWRTHVLRHSSGILSIDNGMRTED